MSKPKQREPKLLDDTPHSDELGRVFQSYVRRSTDHDHRRRRGNSVYRELMDVGRVEAVLPDGRQVVLTHRVNDFRLHYYSLYEDGHKRPVSDVRGLILDRDQVWGWTYGLRLLKQDGR